jgi:hypothetical protein
VLVGAVLSNQTVLFLPRDWAVRFKLLVPLLVPTLMGEGAILILFTSWGLLNTSTSRYHYGPELTESQGTTARPSSSDSTTEIENKQMAICQFPMRKKWPRANIQRDLVYIYIQQSKPFIATWRCL